MEAVLPWLWDDAAGPARVMEELASTGFSVTHWPDAQAVYRADSWTFGEALLGTPLTRIQTMPVKFKDGASSYTSSNVEALLHTDSGGLWIPAHVQIMICVHPAESGGESLLLDSWQLLRDLEQTDQEAFTRCFEAPMQMGFLQPWWGPAVAWRSGNLIFSQPPEPDGHPMAVRLRELVDQAEPITYLCQAGDVLVFNNHRIMHGRHEFTDPCRELLKLHAWLPGPFQAPADFVARAATAAERLAGKFAGEPRHITDYLGLNGVTSALANRRLGAVLQVLAGRCDIVNLQRIARSHGCDPMDLMQWQDTVLLAGLRALASQPIGNELEDAVEIAFNKRLGDELKY